MGSYAVELQNVVKKFGEVVAVDRVSVQVQDGEFFSLLGPSGCGKTTSLRMIAGFEMPTEGNILIQGAQQGYRPPHQRPVNTVFQHYALFPHMTVFENVAFGLEMKKVDKAERNRRVKEALELVHLEGMESRRPKQLSGGQQQRVALARALINRPEVLLLDEPLGALDLKLRKAMQIELKHLQEEVGITFIYVTHDQEEAITMSDRIAVMSKGKILQIGKSQDIYDHPENHFVADFIGESNFIQGVVGSTDPHPEIVVDGQTRLPAGWIQHDLSSGDQAAISVRPEKIQVLLATASKQNPLPDRFVEIPGIIEQAIYLGTDMRYIIRLGQGGEIVSRMQNAGTGERMLAKGDAVLARWHVDFGRLLAGAV